MTISATTNRVSYNGNGVTTAFAFSYPFHAQADLVVISTVIATGVQTTKALTTDYTISGTTDSLGHYSSGGTVNFLTAPASTVRITIYRDPARTQSLNLTENDNLPAESVEARFDYVTMLIQRVADLIGRTPRQPEGDSADIDRLPSKVDRASKYFGFDSDGDPVALAAPTDTSITSAFIETVLDDTDAATARATLGAVGLTGNETIAGNKTLSGSTVISGTLTANAQVTVAVTDARTNTIATPLIVDAPTTGTPATNIGTGILFRTESADEAPSDAMKLSAVNSDVTAGSEDTFFQVMLRTAGSALGIAYEFYRTSQFAALFTHANTANRIYTLPDFAGTLATVAGTESPTNKTFDNTNTFTACIKTTSLASATGSASVNAADLSVTMNDYSFFPSLTASNGNDRWDVQPIHSTADPSNTTGRFYLSRTASDNLPTVTVRWRYITASDDPTMWVAYDPGTGQIMASWASDDPTPDGSPGVVVPGMTSIRLKAQQLEVLSVLNARSADAAALIRDRRLRMAHQAYRALQLHSGDDAPARWLLENCAINPVTGLIRMQP